MRQRAAIRFHLRWVTAAVVSAATLHTPSYACRIVVRTNLEDVRYADVVVVGRISNYRIVRDEAFRRRMLASPRLSADLRRIYEDPRQGLLSDYTRFDILVDEVLVGRAPRRLLVTWDNSTFVEPGEMAAGPYLIALRRSTSAGPPLRGPSATIMPNPESDTLTLLQAPCAGAFVYEVTSEQARRVRSILSARR